MKKRSEEFSCLNHVGGVRSHLTGGCSLNETDAVLLLYDAGSLTIRSEKNGIYTLGFPNEEMEEAFYTDMRDAAQRSPNGTASDIVEVRQALMKPIPDFKAFMNAINSGLLKFPIRAPFEEWYDWQTKFFMKSAGIKVERQREIKN